MKRIKKNKCFDCNNFTNGKRCRKCQDSFKVGQNCFSYKHGLSHTKFDRTYFNARNRCNRLKDKRFRDYGGRGIKFLWKSVEQFRDDMYESYLEHCKKFGEDNTQIERINNNGNYCKENCRWATRKEQCRNTRKNNFITFNGKTFTLTDWSNITGIKITTLFQRIYHSHWSIEKAITTPLMKNQYSFQ